MSKKTNLISEYYQCQTCADKPEMNSHADVIKHLADVHSIAIGTSGTSQMLMHADGPRQYSYTNQIEIGGVTLIQKLTYRRSKSSPTYE